MPFIFFDGAASPVKLMSLAMSTLSTSPTHSSSGHSRPSFVASPLSLLNSLITLLVVKNRIWLIFHCLSSTEISKMKSQILGNGVDHSNSSNECFSFNKILQTQETISVGMPRPQAWPPTKTDHLHRPQDPADASNWPLIY
jgi:hypothetical protein